MRSSANLPRVPVRPLSLILASASPARLALLTQAGVRPTVFVSSVDEEAVLAQARQTYAALAPADVGLLLARAKAEDVAAQCQGALVLGCDSILELDGEIHGKPADEAQAVARWERMSGRSGTLHTGHWLIDRRDPHAGGTAGIVGATASTEVHFGAVTPADIAAYVATGEPLRVAGAFTLDGLGAPYIDGVTGDPSNVVGLSLPLLRALLGNFGIRWADLLSR
jgi:septum formation protein